MIRTLMILPTYGVSEPGWARLLPGVGVRSVWSPNRGMPRPMSEESGVLYRHVLNRDNGPAEVFHDEADYPVFVELVGRACRRGEPTLAETGDRLARRARMEISMSAAAAAAIRAVTAQPAWPETISGQM